MKRLRDAEREPQDEVAARFAADHHFACVRNFDKLFRETGGPFMMESNVMLADCVAMATLNARFPFDANSRPTLTLCQMGC